MGPDSLLRIDCAITLADMSAAKHTMIVLKRVGVILDQLSVRLLSDDCNVFLSQVWNKQQTVLQTST